MVMEGTTVKKEDNWWKGKGMVKKFTKKRKEVVIASHSFVFDERMSMFVLR